uniref:Armadillo-like helical n=1 Tax=Tanacetum cinerariifolium TaxID=118510 RepID=A0A6L2N077_TANCI|nr:armadillo-like helical [Tanacetum cinerariifolium]
MHRFVFIIKTTINYRRRRHHAPPFSPLHRLFSSSSSTTNNHANSTTKAKSLNKIKIPRRPILRNIAITATLISATFAATTFLIKENEYKDEKFKNNNTNKSMFHDFTLESFHKSFKRFMDTVKHTHVAVSVLWKSLSSVLINHEVRLGFEVRVAALLADIVAADERSRAAIVGAGGGVVVDWLLDSVALNKGGGSYGTQAESARALAYLIADCNVAEAVLKRPKAVPNLLRFIFSAHPHPWEQQKMHNSFDIADPLKGRSMLVAVIMDIVTSECDNVDKVSLKPMLSRKAAMRDIAAALEVVEEGGMYLDELRGNGLGINFVGLTRSNGSIELEKPHVKCTNKTRRILLNKITENSPTVIPGLWDDLDSQHVAVPFAAWALANWAMASDVNRSHIQELDHNGHAIMTALVAPERSVKWHGSLVARLLLEDRNLRSDDFVSDWSSCLLSTVSQASKSDDVPLTRVALSAFLLSLERCRGAQKAIMEKSLYLMRGTANRMWKHESIQEALAKGLESLSTGNVHLTLDEGQKWTSILLRWVFGDTSSDATRSSAIRILSHVLEDYAPSSIPISQGWLAILLNDIVKFRMSQLNGSAQPKDKTKIDQANVVYGTQAANQLAGAVVNLAVNQLGKDSFEDLLCIEPFVVPFKNIKKGSVPKVNAADSALATLKGIKTMSEICSDDLLCQTRIIDNGVVSLLRRLLLRDDYEKLAASEAYNASKNIKSVDKDESVPNAHDPSKVHVPPAAHIRRHAARFLTVLSVHPKVKENILNDQVWCDWLENCANENKHRCPHFTEMIYLINPDLPHWKYPVKQRMESTMETSSDNTGSVSHSDPLFDVVFIHGLRGGPYKSWRLSECKYSSKSGLVEKIDEEAGKQGTFWPAEWLSSDFPHARLFTLKYKTNLTQWSGSSLPLQEVSSMLLERLITAGIGDRPVVFVTHSMGGLVVKQMLHQARAENRDKIVSNTVGVVFYSCPHFGSKLADLPWRMGFVLRPAPTIGELRSGSPRLVKLNDFIRRLHKKGALDVLSFCETKVTPIVEGYGGWAFRLEIVPMESSYPGYGKLVVLESTDHVNICKPINRNDPSYSETLHLLQKLRARIHEKKV